MPASRIATRIGFRNYDISIVDDDGATGTDIDLAAGRVVVSDRLPLSELSRVIRECVRHELPPASDLPVSDLPEDDVS